MRGMRVHMDTCRGETRPGITSGDDLPPAFGERREEERDNPAELPDQPPGGIEQNSLELPEQPPRATKQASSSHGEAAAKEEEAVPYEEHLSNTIEDTLKAMFQFVARWSFAYFLAEDQVQRIFTKNDLTNLGEAETQFRLGIERFGLVELFLRKPSLLFLFRKTALLPMTYPKLVKLTDPIFSDETTNQRQREEQTYRLFLNYLKEASAGRRLNGNISLHSILKFVTGCENKPVLDFQMKLTICFDMNMPSCLPLSNTCISRLTLPIGENVSVTKEEVFSFFDYAFANEYFGLI